MKSIADAVTATVLVLTGWGWALYFAAGIIFVGAALVAERCRLGKRDHG